MAVLHHSYLFRANEFRLFIRPYVDALRAGDDGPLREKAVSISVLPAVKAFLEDMRSDVGYEEGWSEIEPQVLLSMLLVEFATPYPIGQQFGENGWSMFHMATTAAELAGWAPIDVWRLHRGRELCLLWEEEPQLEDVEFNLKCRGLTGWLGTEDIARYKGEMELLRPRADEIASLYRAKWPGIHPDMDRDLSNLIDESLGRFCATFDAALSSRQQLLISTVS